MQDISIFTTCCRKHSYMRDIAMFTTRCRKHSYMRDIAIFTAHCRKHSYMHYMAMFTECRNYNIRVMFTSRRNPSHGVYDNYCIFGYNATLRVMIEILLLLQCGESFPKYFHYIFYKKSANGSSK